MEWFLCLTGAALAMCGIFDGPVGSLTAGAASMVLIGAIFILLAIAKSEQIWPFRLSKPAVSQSAFNDLHPDKPAFTREPLRRHRVMIARRRQGGGSSL